MYPKTLDLNGEKTLKLKGQTVGVILDLISELKFKVANQLMEEIIPQLQEQEKKDEAVTP